MLQGKQRLFLVVFAALLLALASGATAATIAVSSTGDNFTPGDSACTLREAIENADVAGDVTGGDCIAGTGGVDTILFIVSGTITLNTQLPNIITNVTIDGNHTITIDGNHALQIVDVTGTVELKNLTIVNSGGSDAAVGNENNLTVTNCILSGNVATGGGNGGAIHNNGTLVVTNSTFSGNSVDGGIGGAINNDFTATITGSTFSGNSAAEGGAISNFGPLDVTDSTFSGNTATVEGGAIDNYAFDGVMNLTNSTFSGNTSIGNGGAIFNNEVLTMVNCTFAGNGGLDGGAIFNNAIANASNSIFANSTSGNNCGGDFLNDNGNNIDSDAKCISGLPVNPLLDPAGLQDNGGPTMTIGLQLGSPAIDAGNDTVCNTAPVNGVDQRGVARPQDGDGDSNARCDIGAVEQQRGLLFSDDFSDDDSSDWKPTKGTWSGSLAELEGTTIKKADDISPFSAGCGACTIEVDTTIVTSGTRASILGWRKDKSNYVEVAFMQDKARIQLKQHKSGTVVAKKKIDFVLVPGQTYHVKLAFSNNQFNLFIDSNPTPVMTVSTTSSPFGGLGVRLKSTTGLNGTATWDNWIVY